MSEALPQMKENHFAENLQHLETFQATPTNQNHVRTEIYTCSFMSGNGGMIRSNSMNGTKSLQHPSRPTSLPEPIVPKDGGHQTPSNCETGNQLNAALLGPTYPSVVGVHDTEDWLDKHAEKIDDGFVCDFLALAADVTAKDGEEHEVKDNRDVRVEKHASDRVPLSTLNGNWKNPLGKEEGVSPDRFMTGAEGLQGEDEALKQNPFKFDCAFGYTGRFEPPPTPPSTRVGFLTAMKTEITKIGVLQSGMQAYQREINSRKHHIFSTRFLVDQNTAIIVTLAQLDQIIQYIKRAQEEVEAIQDEDAVIENKLVMEFQQAQSWVARTRAILVHSHVFYKINFVLPGQKLH